MAKKAALSVRISESTKEAIDKEAAKERRSTASLVEIILMDFLQETRKYAGDGDLPGRLWRVRYRDRRGKMAKGV
jgi:hypothetical protein